MNAILGGATNILPDAITQKLGGIGHNKSEPHSPAKSSASPSKAGSGPSPEELQAQTQAAEEERRRKHQQQEKERERVRSEIRYKYGIQADASPAHCTASYDQRRKSALSEDFVVSAGGTRHGSKSLPNDNNLAASCGNSADADSLRSEDQSKLLGQVNTLAKEYMGKARTGLMDIVGGVKTFLPFGK